MQLVVQMTMLDAHPGPGHCTVLGHCRRVLLQVVQSTLHLSAELIWKKLAPCMDHGSM